MSEVDHRETERVQPVMVFFVSFLLHKRNEKQSVSSEFLLKTAKSCHQPVQVRNKTVQVGRKTARVDKKTVQVGEKTGRKNEKTVQVNR